MSVLEVTEMFKEKMLELQDEPEFQWSLDKTKYAVTEKGAPHIKLAIGNTSLDYDLWGGLRNSVTIGLHLVGLKEVWEYYTNRKKEIVDESGRPTIFQIPRSFNFEIHRENLHNQNI